MILLGSKTLAATSNSISVSGLVANVHLFVVTNFLCTSDPDISYSLRFNNDNGSNYRRERSPLPSFTSLELISGGGGTTFIETAMWLDILNVAAQRKHVSCRSSVISQGGFYHSSNICGIWNNQVNSINTVTIGSGQPVLLAGSALWVFGLI